MRRTVRGNRTRGSTQKITNNTKSFGIMGGLAPQRNVSVSTLRGYREGHAQLKQRIPLAPAPGLDYMLGNNPMSKYLLSKNPVGSGGVGNMIPNIPCCSAGTLNYVEEKVEVENTNDEKEEEETYPSWAMMLPEEARETWIKEEEYENEMLSYWKSFSSTGPYWPTTVTVRIFTCDLLKLHCSNPFQYIELTPGDNLCKSTESTPPIYKSASPNLTLSYTDNKWKLHGTYLVQDVSDKALATIHKKERTPLPSQLHGIQIWSGLSLVKLSSSFDASDLSIWGCNNGNCVVCGGDADSAAGCPNLPNCKGGWKCANNHCTAETDGTLQQGCPNTSCKPPPSAPKYTCKNNKCVADDRGTQDKATCKSTCSGGGGGGGTTHKNFYVNGYYGNAGDCIQSLPPLATGSKSEIPEAYNIITLTFLEFDTKGQLCFIIQGPYAGASSKSSNDGTPTEPWCDVSGNIEVNLQHPDATLLKDDIAKWRKIKDPWGRQKFVLVSIGGGKGSANWPPPAPEHISTQIKKFVTTYDLDGIDIDLENTQSRDLLIPTINDLRNLKDKKYIITCAPQASTGEIEEYRSKIIPNCDYVGLQCYNQPPNALDVDWEQFNDSYSAASLKWDSIGTPAAAASTSPWLPAKPDTTMWNAAIWGAYQQWIYDCSGVWQSCPTQTQYGVLVPASPLAAGSNNDWDFGNNTQDPEKSDGLLGTLIKLYNNKPNLLNMRYIGTWSIGCDLLADETTTKPRFSTAMSAFLNYMKKHPK